VPQGDPTKNHQNHKDKQNQQKPIKPAKTTKPDGIQRKMSILILMDIKGNVDGDHRKWRRRRRRRRQRHRRARVPRGQWVPCGNRAVVNLMEINGKW
jgi:hypothetical protein